MPSERVVNIGTHPSRRVPKEDSFKMDRGFVRYHLRYIPIRSKAMLVYTALCIVVGYERQNVSCAHAELAETAGCTTRTVSKALHLLERRKLVTITRKLGERDRFTLITPVKPLGLEAV